MRTLHLTSLPLTIAILAGCGGSQTPMLQLSPQVPQSGKSWMLPGSSSGDLVYAASGANVYIYSYPGGKQVGELTGFHDALGACSDANGKVWITDAAGNYTGGSLVEYAHGGTTPIATLEDQGDFIPIACSVDPSTGNLAAANHIRGGAEYPITVWTNAQGSPTYYQRTLGVAANDPFTIAYYKGSDLYIRSMRYKKGEAWLPKGGSSIEQFSVRKHGYYVRDGRYLVIGGELRGKREILTLYSLNGASGTVEGKVTLDFVPSVCYPTGPFAIQGSELATVCGSKIVYYKYPSGGSSITIISNVDATGIAISVAPSHSRTRR